MHLVVGRAIVNIFNNNLYNTDTMMVSGDEKFNKTHTTNLDTNFNENYQFNENFPLIGRGTDGTNLGLIHKK